MPELLGSYRQHQRHRSHDAQRDATWLRNTCYAETEVDELARRIEESPVRRWHVKPTLAVPRAPARAPGQSSRENSFIPLENVPALIKCTVGAGRRRVSPYVGQIVLAVAVRQRTVYSIAGRTAVIVRRISRASRGSRVRKRVGSRRIFPVVLDLGIIVRRFVPLIFRGKKPLGTGGARDHSQSCSRERTIERVSAGFSRARSLRSGWLTVIQPIGESGRVPPVHVRNRMIGRADHAI